MVKVLQSRKYKHAPIVEAVLDIAVRFEPAIPIIDLQTVYDGQKAYSAASPLIDHTFKGRLDSGDPSVERTSKVSGFMYLSEKKDQLFHSKSTGFTFSRATPYTSWEIFSGEAKRLWSIYRRLNPVEITRIGLRYINRIDIPLPMENFEDYYLNFPKVADGLSQGLSQYLMSLTIPYPATQSTAIINQTLVPPAKDNVASTLLDIDCFRTENLSNDDAALWQIFEELKAQENTIFEACITDKAKELFD